MSAEELFSSYYHQSSNYADTTSHADTHLEMNDDGGPKPWGDGHSDIHTDEY